MVNAISGSETSLPAGGWTSALGMSACTLMLHFVPGETRVKSQIACHFTGSVIGYSNGSRLDLCGKHPKNSLPVKGGAV